ncbi:MAG: peptidoglycan DD-metalloendopeptidase family protein [Bacteroidota bacterium]
MIKSNSKYHKLRLFPTLAIICLVFLHGMALAQQNKKSEKLQQTKKQLEQEIKYTTDLLEKTRKSKQISLNKVKILQKQIQTREGLINAINQELKDTEVQLTVETIQLNRMSGQLQTLKAEYARMIYNAYRTMNGHNKLMFIFSARDFNQAYQRLKYFQQYASYRRTQAAKIETTRRYINTHRNELENIRDQKLNLVQSQTLEKQKLDREKQEKDNAVREFSSKEKQLFSTLKTKQQAAQKLTSEIEKIINAEIIASEERLQKKEAKEKKTSAKINSDKAKFPTTTAKLELTPVEAQLSSSFSANRGKLPWPCEHGFISGSYGEHPHPVLKNITVKNNGVDIMTEQNSQVRTVFVGRVSKVMSFQYLNKVVIIRHGDYLTVYSNLGEVTVREGDEVKAKQVIGKVQNNADDQRPELHFELWRGKVILNPETWLANR